MTGAVEAIDGLLAALEKGCEEAIDDSLSPGSIASAAVAAAGDAAAAADDAAPAPSAAADAAPVPQRTMPPLPSARVGGWWVGPGGVVEVAMREAPRQRFRRDGEPPLPLGSQVGDWQCQRSHHKCPAWHRKRSPHCLRCGEDRPPREHRPRSRSPRRWAQRRPSPIRGPY
eukprot:14104111-Alexandrium_andersonii.AAC.1